MPRITKQAKQLVYKTKDFLLKFLIGLFFNSLLSLFDVNSVLII